VAWAAVAAGARGSLGGRPPKDRRRVLNGILWILRSGARWRDLPERYGPWQTVANSFYRWRRAGVWSRVLAELQRQADERGELDRALHHVDSTVVRAHPHAAGAKGQQHEALGRSRGGFSTKIHVRCDGNGRPLVFHPTGGEAAATKALPHLLDSWQVRRASPGRPRKRPERLVADRGYSNRHVRNLLRRRGIGSVIPQPGNQRPRFLLDLQAYHARNQALRLVGRPKPCRRIATCYVRAAEADRSVPPTTSPCCRSPPSCSGCRFENTAYTLLGAGRARTASFPERPKPDSGLDPKTPPSRPFTRRSLEQAQGLALVSVTASPLHLA
jgi:transposase